MTMLRTQELRKVQEQILAERREIAEVQKSVLDVQKSVDDLNLKQGGSSSKMRADLTNMLSELETQISRLHGDIDETQHRLGQVGQKLDRLEQRKIVVSGSAPAPQGGADTSVNPGTGTAPTVKVVEGLDLENLFNQSREDYIRGKYDLAFKGFNTVYDKDATGSYKEAAEYWMAECLWKGDKADKAVEMYQRVLKEFPKGGKTCASRFKLGLIFDQKKDEGRRNDTWKLLLDECPQSNEAERARELMKP